ncbi:major facilitator superfamily transporter [Nitzschia inconspicua]|uniref:Major facilitator superfamily transporter n=1 Tax=Nitzschia inconspicua TaxID=303405 RepID=A0A9K3LYG3_9STRA|nr:major facilitator superfamily transporter [Nitzschia inconspicua]
MVEFGKTLLSAQDEEWKEYYVDYSLLKFLIGKAKKNQKKQQKKKSMQEETIEESEETNKTNHRKNNSSFGDLLDWMNSSDTFDHTKGNKLIDKSRHVRTNSGSLLATATATASTTSLRDTNSRQFQHMVQDGYLKALEFRQVLDQQIEKLVLFSLSREGTLAHKLYELSKRRLQLKETLYHVVLLSQQPTTLLVSQEPSLATRIQHSYAALAALTIHYREAATQLLELLEFLDLNITALRKILKKHDKNFPHFKLSGTYLRQRFQEHATDDITYNEDLGSGQIMQQLYHFGGLSTLLLTLRSAFDELHSLEWNLLAVQHFQIQQQQQQVHNYPPALYPVTSEPPSYGSISLIQQDSPARPYSKTPKFDNRKVEMLSEETALQPSNAPPPPPPGRPPLPSAHQRRGSSSLTSPLRALFKKPSQRNIPSQLDGRITHAREPLLDQIAAARNRLKETTQYAQHVAAQALVFDDTEDTFPDKDKTPASQFTLEQKISSFLNLASCALYMTNYYVVAPTVGEYAQQLGSSESMAGIIIGMTPNAALFATVLYGWWSNYSYRNSLIFASCSSVLGNILYALALHYNSLTMVLLGRFFNGFGSARSINRRYIADTFSKADRTAASADFVTSGALGMATGPAIAFLLGQVSFPVGNTLWSPTTAPGWVMLCLWSIYLILSILFFQEPDRSHLFDSPKDKDIENESTTKPTKESVPTTISNEISETQPFLGQDTFLRLGSGDSELSVSDSNERTAENEPPLWKNAAVMNSLWLYFVLKLVLEMLLSSTPTVTKYYFGWHSNITGLFMMIMALLMFPANLVVAKLSQHYEDRELIVWTLIMMMVSVLGIMSYANQYFTIQYIVFAIGIFISSNSLEGPNMGLLSKTIPKSWAKGTFNSGFLATEAGTLARSVGDILISGVEGSFGVSMLLNGLFLPMSALVFVSLLLVRRFYDQMTESDDDDTASIASGSVDDGNDRKTSNA